jgi:ribonucleoside-diphosphate reductase alpha subunit
MSDINLPMFVIKRNGNKEKVQFNKITKRICSVIKKEEKDILDSAIIAQKVISSIYSGITTEEVDNETAKICINMITINPLYGELAGRIAVSNLHKKTLNSFVDKMNKINEHNPELLDQQWLKWVNNNKVELENIIDYSRDYDFDYFGFKTLERSYLIRDLNTRQIYERPQDMFLRVASYICMGDIDMVKNTYNELSNKKYIHATPTNFNAGTSRPQLSSCFLMPFVDDSIDGIYDTLKNCAKISKWAGGIGLHVSNIRSKGSVIKGTNGISNGIIPMLQVFNSTARYVDQGGGKRKGSIAIYIEPHHSDIYEFLELRKNFGAETERARDLFTALWVSDLFMEQVENDGDWYLMCPNKCPNLNEVYGDEYKKIYWEYVKENNYRKKVKARHLMEAIMDSQLETGTPYITYKDHVNNKSNQKNIGIIKSSNLCNEIVEVSNKEEHAVCNLASIAVNTFLVPFKTHRQWIIYTKENCKYCRWAKKYMNSKGFKYTEKTEFDDEALKVIKKKVECEGDACKMGSITFPQIFYGKQYIGGFEELVKFTADKYDYEQLWKTAYIATKNLNNIIDKNYYPTPETKCSNIRNRPIGLGIQGLADTLAKMKLCFDSEEAVEFNSKMMETIYNASITASNDMAIDRYEMVKHLKETVNNLPEYYDNNYFVNGTTPIDNINIEDNNLENEYYHKLRLTNRELHNLNKCYGSYSTFEGSPMSEGIFQFDMWNVKPTMYNWEELKEKVINYGVRNSLMVALMPTASTSQILGNNECFEWFTSNIYTRNTLAGDFPLVNKHLVNDLINIGEWNNDVKQIIIADDGSVKCLDNIPTYYKKLYKTIWEIKQIWVLKQALARAPFVDQTQSMNIYMAVPDYKKLLNCHMWGWKNGLKTGMYYLRSKPAANAIKFTIDPTLQKKIQEQYEVCESCSA